MRPLPVCAGCKSYCLIFLILLVQTSALAQPPRQPVAETLPELLSAIEHAMERNHIPGLMLAIVSKDSVIFSGGLGYSDLASQRKVDGKQKFRLGSTTKLMVAMGILHLVDNGKVSLDAKVSDIVPEIEFNNPWEDTYPLKIIHLLEHTSGFGDAFMNKTVNLTQRDKVGLQVIRFYQDELVCRMKPGTVPAYNNLNYTLLGYIIERLSGIEWADYLRLNVLMPIGMNNTDFLLRIPDNQEYAQGYYFREGKHEPVPANFSLHSNGAHGSMNSCADDMAKLVRFFLNDWKLDNGRWLPESYLDEMEVAHSTLGAKHGITNGYGLGNHIESWHPKTTFHGHGGTIQGFMAHMIYDRVNGIGMAIARNGGRDDVEIGMLITDFLTRNLEVIQPTTAEIPSDSIKPYLGYYEPILTATRYGFLQNLVADISIQQRGNELFVKPLRGWPLPLTHVGELKFRRSFEHDALYTFGHDDEGNAIFMSAAPRGGSYFIKTSVAWIVIKRCLAILGFISLVVGLFLGALSIVKLMLRKIDRRQLSVRIFPMLAALSLFISLIPLIRWESNYLLFTEPNAVTLTHITGMYLFGIFSALALWFLYARWNEIATIRMKLLLTYTTLGTAVVALIFLYHGMMQPIWNW